MSPKMGLRIFAAALAFMATAFFNTAPAMAQAADPAAKQIETFYATLTDAMKSGGSVQSRYNKLKPTIDQVFDLKGMTILAVGPTAWAAIAPADQTALVTAFGRMTAANYAKNFDSYSGQKFSVDPTVEVRGQDKLVKSKLVSGSDTIPFVYRMRNNKVIDIFLNGNISQMATQRSDFTSTMASGGAPALVKKLNDMSDKLLR
jgi:phospholipid transport system substrate-binding protein